MRRLALAAIFAGMALAQTPIHKVWPRIPTGLPDGTRVTVVAFVNRGVPSHLSVRGGDADPKAAQAIVAAVKHWRFATPADGAAPSRFTLVAEARNGIFQVRETR